MTKKIILGVDPGYGRTGLGLISFDKEELILLNADCIETPSYEEDMGKRLLLLRQKLFIFLEYGKPEVAVMEKLFFSRNVTTAMKVAEARGVILSVFAERNIPVVEYTPNQVKKTVGGDGKIKKTALKHITMDYLKISKIPGPDDVADACAIALCYALNEMKPVVV